MNKALVRIAGLAAVAAVIAGIVLSARKSSAQLRLALVPKSVGHPYWEGVKAGMEAAALQNGVRAVFHGPAAASIDEQIRIVEDFIAQGYNGIGISPNDPNAVKDVIRRAMDRGIAIVTFDSDSPDSDRLLYIGTDNRKAGFKAGQEMIKLLGAANAEATGVLLVQIIGGNPGVQNLTERINGFKEAVQGTNIKLCDVLFNEESPNRSLEVAENALTAHPDLRGFFCSNAFGGPGAALAIKGAIQRGRIKAGQVHVVAFDTTEDILNYIQEGVIDCTLAQKTHAMGELSVDHLIRFASEFRRTGKFTRPAKPVIDTGVAIVYPEDIAAYRTPAEKK